MGMAEEMEPKPFGVSDEQLVVEPTVYREDLFTGKTALVSGAGSGIGKGIAYLLGRLGAAVVICGRKEEKLRVTENWLQKIGAEVDVHAMTIRDPEQVKALVDAVWDKHGQLDLLVNNAGGQFPQPAIEFSPKGWNAVIETNLTGTWYMMQEAARHWRDHDQSGSIVNIIADFWRGMPYIAHTCAARAGVSYLSKTLAIEWAPLNIRVNCIAPGTIETEGLNVYPRQELEKLGHHNVMKRFGTVMDVAEAVVYLGGPSGAFITGETLTIDGGQQMWGDAWALGRPEYFDQPK